MFGRYMLDLVSRHKFKTVTCDLTFRSFFFFFFTAWCLRSEGVSSVLLGVSNTDQLLENLGALRVQFVSFFPPTSIILPDVVNHSYLKKLVSYFVYNKEWPKLA